MKIEVILSIILMVWACVSGDETDSSSEHEDEADDELDLDKRFKCAFECENGVPEQNPDYKPSFNGCGSYGVNVDFRKCPYLTECCNQHDLCYDICGSDWSQCDSDFKTCTHTPPESYAKHKKALCKSIGDAMYYTVRIAGCPAFKNAQKKSCICK